VPVWIRLGISVARATARITERDGAKPEDTDVVDDKAMAALLVARPIKSGFQVGRPHEVVQITQAL